MISNNKISNIINSQVPFFIRNDHQNFVTFLEKYYEFLEQDTQVVNRTKNFLRYQDIDLTEDDFADKLYTAFLKHIPEDVLVDRSYIIKHIKDFYRAKGTEKSARFLMRAIFDEEIEFYYPKKDVLRVSDGKWFIQRSIRISDTRLANVSNNNLSGLEKFISTRITGATSNASATVERVDRFFQNGTQIDELILSNIDGAFRNGETVWSVFDDVETTTQISANIFSGIINSIEITNAGSLYHIGDPVVIVSSSGSGAEASVARVSSGNLTSIAVISGGAGYKVNDDLLITGGGGSGANANVATVLLDGSYHPNSYNIMSSTISLEANTLLSNAVYSNLNSSNANVRLSNACSFWTYSNTGPASSIVLNASGSDYTSPPTLSIVANTKVVALGILGRMEIANGGSNYQIGDTITFSGGDGFGAAANVTNVNPAAGNTITAVRFVRVGTEQIGGMGYAQENLPTATVNSANGTGANVVVTAILGAGATLKPAASRIGAIERIVITSRGSGYLTAPEIDLTGSGDGMANAVADIVAGVFSYPGRYLNDDGHISSYNFIQDRDYYQSFSYVIKSRQSINQYRKAFKDLVHPAGMKLFGEYLYVAVQDITGNLRASDSQHMSIKSMPYTKTGNTINIAYPAASRAVPLANNDNVYLTFVSGNQANVVNSIYQITLPNTNYIIANAKTVTGNTSGNVEVGIFRA